MGLNDRLVNDLRRSEKNASREPYYAEEPDWMIYAERKKTPPLNEYNGLKEQTDVTSINKAPSVFDRGTVFRTDRGR